MLSDPNLPQLPLPTATSLYSLSLFISMTTFHSPIHPLSGVGNYTCGSPQTSAPPSSACTKMAFCGDPDDSTWIHWNDWLWFILCHAMQRWHFSVTSVCASTDSLSTWHINIQFFFFFFHRVPLLDLKTRISLSKSSNPLGEGLGRVLEIWLTEDSSWSQMKYFTLSNVVDLFVLSWEKGQINEISMFSEL